MAFELSKRRIDVPQIQPIQRKIPIEQIIAIQGQNPLAQGIEASGQLIGQALARKAQLQREGQELAKLEQLAGQQAGAFQGLNPSTATAFTNKMIGERANNYTPQQLEAIYKGDPNAISSAFNGSIPKDAASLSASVSSKESQRDALKAERDAKREQQINKDILGYSEALEKNPISKKIKEQGIGLDQMKQLLDIAKSGNTVASTAMGTKAARAMGEVGVLTETDIKRYVQSGRLDRAAGDKLSQWIQGRPSMATLDEINQISEVLNDSFDQKIQPIYNTYVERLSRNYKITPEEAAYRLAVDYKPIKNLPKIESPGKATHRWNPITQRVEVVR